jgi:PAS domain S-box-containing protein
MNSNQQKLPASWQLILLFIIISISVLIAGGFYYNFTRKSSLTEKQEELATIAYLKIRQITQWRLERLSDGQFFRDNFLMVGKTSEYIKNPENSALHNDILPFLKSLTTNFDYTKAIILDCNGNPLLAYPGPDSSLSETLKSKLPEIIKQREALLSDLYLTDSGNFVSLDLLVPLIDHNFNDKIVLGILVLRIDPQKVLYPLIQSWPTPSKSAETLLLRREGNEILYLNELRHQKKTELILRKPVASKNLPASLAVQGIKGTVNGIDYRDVPVIAAMNKIPGTQWYMVAKIDKEEIISELNDQMRMIVALIVLFILAIGLFLGFIRRNQRVRFFQEKYEIELERLTLIKHFEYILKFANDIILLIDEKLRIVEANDRALEYYQYTREEFIGLSLQKIRASETLPQMQQQLKTVDDNESATFETIHVRKDTSVFPVEVSSRRILIEGSYYYQTIARDITDRKRAEETLRESEEKFRKIFEESPFSMAMTGKDLMIVSANSSFCKMTGYEEHELKSYTFRDLTHPDYVADSEVSILRLIAGEIPIYQVEKKYLRKDKTEIWGSTTVSIITNKRGEIQHFLVMIEDITQHKNAEEQIRESRERLMSIFRVAPTGIGVVRDRILYDINTRICEITGYNAEELIGKSSRMLYASQREFDLVGEEKYRQIKEKGTGYIETKWKRKDGDLIDILLASTPLFENDISRGVTFTALDITDRKKAAEELLIAKEKAEESDRLKTSFLHNVSHEIRTPMNAIIGFSSLLSEPGVSEDERQQYCDIIFQSSNQLLSIINDIVDIANVESGQVKMNLKIFNLNLTLRNIIEQYQYIKSKDANIPIHLKTGLSDDVSQIRTDDVKLIQIISNLVNNSLKFTTSGEVVVSYVLKDRFLEFSVRDTGIGISANHIDKIFKRFYQVDGAVSRQFGGTGLGLSICKAYVELLGGEISVQSEQGKGSLFIFTIPYLSV